MLKLRPYQEEAVAAVYQALRDRDDNPCVVIPTAGGKTPVMATICKDAVGRWGGRVLILAHVKELLQQAAGKLNLVCPEIDVGVYSAGLKRRDTRHSVIVAGIQSVYRKACDLDAFDLVLIDEAHLLPPDGEGMYRTFLKDARAVNPNLRVVGFTATPFRMKSGMICAPENVLNHVCFEIGVKELIVQGYLCPLVTRASRNKIDTSGLHIRAGEFVAGEAEELMDHSDLVEAAYRQIKLTTGKEPAEITRDEWNAFKKEHPKLEFEASVIHQLKEVRNRASYDGVFVKKEYLLNNMLEFKHIIELLHNLISTNQKTQKHF